MAQETEYGVKVTVLLLREGKFSVRTILYGAEALENLKPGDRIDTTARLTASFRIENEDVTTFTSKGVFLLAYQKGDASVTTADAVPFRYFPAVMARRLNETIETIFGENLSPFMKALLLGDRTRLSDPFVSALSVSGLSHTVAVSGMHISFLVGFILLLTGRKKRSALIAIPLVLLFMLVAGSTPSVVRAGILQNMLLLAPLLGRENDTPTSLSFALMLILLFNPFAAAGIGLQLSFAAIVGITLFSEKINRTLLGELAGLKKPNRIQKVLAASLASSLSAMAFTTPLVAVYFDYVSLVAPVSNLLALWAVSFAFVGGLLAALVGLISIPLGTAAAFLVMPGANYMVTLIPLMAKIPFAAVYTVNEYVRFWLLYVYLMLGLCILGRAGNGVWYLRGLWLRRDCA